MSCYWHTWASPTNRGGLVFAEDADDTYWFNFRIFPHSLRLGWLKSWSNRELWRKPNHEPIIISNFNPECASLINSCQFLLSKIIRREFQVHFEIWDQDFDIETTKSLTLSLRRDSVSSVIFVLHFIQLFSDQKTRYRDACRINYVT